MTDRTQDIRCATVLGWTDITHPGDSAVLVGRQADGKLYLVPFWSSSIKDAVELVDHARRFGLYVFELRYSAVHAYWYAAFAVDFEQIETNDDLWQHAEIPAAAITEAFLAASDSGRAGRE